MSAYLRVPTYDTAVGKWEHTEFANRDAFVQFLESCFKEPGEYAFDESSRLFNHQARRFDADGTYCVHPFLSKDFVTYWDTEKEKCRKGAIFKNKGKTWYLPRGYYMWLNFLPIYHKEIKRFAFPELRDAQYHMALYEEIAQHSYKHAAILKKRQIASSYFHGGVMVNRFWFEEGSICKMGGSLKDYINDKGTWRFLEEYRSFLNQHTAWYRPCNPDKVLNWEQKIEIVSDGRKTDKGLKSVILGYALDKDPTNGVGGPCDFFFHEEAGIAPRMNDTLEYLLPALKSGMIYTGMFVVAGSVGDLDQCEPLKELILNPASKDVLAVRTNLMDENGGEGMCGLFIPEQWSMPPCIDEYGNSLVEKALEMIRIEREQWKKDLKPQDYQLRVSQKPTNITEAFAYRKASVFPLHLVNKQIRRIEEKEYFTEYVELSRNDQGQVVSESTRRLPILEFPISPKTQDKEGVIVVYERPVVDAPWGTYYGSVDPVGEGRTTTSESLCSIIIYKNPLEITRHKKDGSTETVVERDKVVASWCGRFDDLKKTHERLELLIEWYNAWTLVENNVSLFIQYMIERRKQKYLVPKNQVSFLKELGANANVYQEYGWKNTGTIFKAHLLSYGINFMTEEIDVETKPDGTIVQIHRGIERIPDVMILREAAAYQFGMNVDRLVAYCALVSFAKLQQSNRGYLKKREREEGSEQKPKINVKLSMSPFRNLGRGSSKRPPRQPFKNHR